MHDRLGMALLAWGLVGACAGAPPPPVDDAPPVSSQDCAACHPAESAAWAKSHHARAEQPVGAVASAFTGPPTVRLTDTQGEAVRPVLRVIGVDPLWQPMVAAPGGRMQVSNVAYDPARREWFDVFPDARSPGDWGHWSGGGMTWNSQCAHCHDTGVDRAWDPAAGTYNTGIDELGVGCAACHGDAAAHARDPKQPTAAPHDREATQATCERCHTRGVPLVDHPSAGAPLLDVLLPAVPGADGTWWPDGQIRDEAFEGAVFRTSLMHDQGVRCVDCHDPHTGATVRAGDALCLGCHATNPKFVPTHAHHEGVAKPPSCVDCHMPTTVYMQRHPRHDHGMRVPDPALSAELGSPDACAACHADRKVTIAAAATWWTPRTRERDRARAIAAAQAGLADATTRLDTALAAETHPFWRDVLIAAGATPPAPLTDAWAKLARASTAAGLERVPADVTPGDPLAVRLATARAALGGLDMSPALDAELGRWLSANTDYGGAALTLGGWQAVHGHAREAVEAYARAVSLDPASSDAWHGLAVAQSAAGDAAGALATLDQALTRRPFDASLHYARGLALAGVDRVNEASDAFARALQIDPTHPRAAYNAGLALHQLAKDPEAIAMLRRAMKNAPDDPAPPYALATILFARGDMTGARDAALDALKAQPAHADATALLERIDAR